MNCFCRSKLPQPAFHLAVATSHRYTGAEGKKAGFIQQTASSQELVCAARRVGAELAGEHDRRTLRIMKHDLYHELCQTLTEPCCFLSKL